MGIAQNEQTPQSLLLRLVSRQNRHVKEVGNSPSPFSASQPTLSTKQHNYTLTRCARLARRERDQHVHARVVVLPVIIHDAAWQQRGRRRGRRGKACELRVLAY